MGFHSWGNQNNVLSLLRYVTISSIKSTNPLHRGGRYPAYKYVNILLLIIAMHVTSILIRLLLFSWMSGKNVTDIFSIFAEIHVEHVNVWKLPVFHNGEFLCHGKICHLVPIVLECHIMILFFFRKFCGRLQDFRPDQKVRRRGFGSKFLYIYDCDIWCI